MGYLNLDYWTVDWATDDHYQSMIGQMVTVYITECMTGSQQQEVHVVESGQTS